MKILFLQKKIFGATHKKLKTNTMKTDFYTIKNNVWTKTKLNDKYLSWHWILLYNDDLTEKGIGMYPTKVDTMKLKYD